MSVNWAGRLGRETRFLTLFTDVVIPIGQTDQLKLEGEEDRTHDQTVGHANIPPDRRAEEAKGNHREYDECDALLQNLQLRNAPLIGANSISRDLKEIFEE